MLNYSFSQLPHFFSSPALSVCQLNFCPPSSSHFFLPPFHEEKFPICTIACLIRMVMMTVSAVCQQLGFFQVIGREFWYCVGRNSKKWHTGLLLTPSIENKHYYFITNKLWNPIKSTVILASTEFHDKGNIPDSNSSSWGIIFVGSGTGL